ncbi:aminoglycoside phosphotransferase family protein [Actinopolymorpha sp. B11F2]|uniref:aminoglycoside phosphotransferase family protein n=1 Tax=Actinopolymorpha sp. B11F2 TaxID=3160862 RepID=UPI0032E40A73
MIDIPTSFARGIVEREGESAHAWVQSLPRLVDEILQRWRCTPTERIVGGGVGIILAVRRHDGSPAVVKVSFPHPGNVYEPHAFATWGGRGAVRLYERDDANFAMLLEQADWQTLDDLGDVDQAIAVAGHLARRLAVQAPPSLPRLSDQVEEWEETLRKDADSLGHPLSQRALAAALATLRDLGRNQPDTMVHGDLHFGNVVRAEREPWLVVDPKGYVGDLAFDALTVLVRGVDSLREADDLEAELRRRLAIFSDAAEVDRERVTRWVQARTAIGAHHSRRVGDPAWAIHLLEQTAEFLAR